MRRDPEPLGSRCWTAGRAGCPLPPPLLTTPDPDPALGIAHAASMSRLSAPEPIPNQASTTCEGSAVEMRRVKVESMDQPTFRCNPQEGDANDPWNLSVRLSKHDSDSSTPLVVCQAGAGALPMVHAQRGSGAAAARAEIARMRQVRAGQTMLKALCGTRLYSFDAQLRRTAPQPLRPRPAHSDESFTANKSANPTPTECAVVSLFRARRGETPNKAHESNRQTLLLV